MSNIVEEQAPLASLVSLGIKPHPSIGEDKFTQDVKKIVRRPEVCIQSIRCMHVLQDEMGKMKALALINSGSENALFLFCPGTSEEQLQRAGTGAELLVLEQIIPIKPDVDMQQQARDRKRASMVEESEVGIYITIGSVPVLSLLVPFSVSLMEVLQKVKIAIHNSRGRTQTFDWLTHYTKLIADTFPHEVARNSVLDSSSGEGSISTPLIELENSSSPPHGPFMDLKSSLKDKNGSPRRGTHLDLTKTELEFLEDPNALLKMPRSTRLSPSLDRRRAKSRSDTNLTKIPKDQFKKIKKKSVDDKGLTSSFTTFYTDVGSVLSPHSLHCNGGGTHEVSAINERSSQSDSDLRMTSSLSSSTSSNHHTSPHHKVVKSRFYVNPMENEKGIHLELKQLNKSASADNFDSEGAVGNQIEDSQYVEEGTVQFEDCDVTQTIGKRANDSQTKQKGKGKFQSIGYAIRSIQDSWLPTHPHPEPQKVISKGPLQLADQDRRRMTASLREREVHDRSKSEPLVPQWTRGGYTPDTAAWLKWINENILKTDLYTRYVLELHSLPHQVVYAKMRARHDEFTYQESYFVFVTTFNVNGRSTPPHLRNWLGAIPENNKIPDLYVIGFQELDLSAEAIMTSGGNKMEEEWKEAIEVCLRVVGTYKCVRAVRMVGVYLLVYCKGSLAQRISEVDSDSVATGVLGIIGNKGGVSIRFRIHHTEICFVNSHLAAHTTEVERRNQDFNDILAKTYFTNLMRPKGIVGHDIIVWLGDLNYRLINTPDVTVETLKDLIAKEQFEALFEYDQLRIEIEKDRVFSDFFEAPLSFKPTYKYNPGTDEWDSSEKHRPPAWCDRILWRGSHIGLLEYRSHPHIKISDHKPVSAYFEVGIKVIDDEKERKVFEDICWLLDKEENEYLPQVEINELSPKFHEIHFAKPVTKGITVKNVGQNTVSLSFIPKIDETEICKSWLTISPEMSVINPKESIEIQFTIEIEEDLAWTFNKNKKLEDILILHLEGGKDFFITIQGTYIASCFGSSLEYLSHLRVPFFQVQVPTGDLIDIGEPITIKQSTTRCRQSLIEDDKVELPQELVAMVEYLKERGDKTENLFQERGLKWEMDSIRENLDTGNPLSGSVHSVAACLISFLAALENPVIPFHLQPKCLEASSSFIICKQVLFKEFPEAHKAAFRYIIRFLQHLLKDITHNKLDITAISHIFGSVLLRSSYKIRAKSQSQSQSREELQIAKKKCLFIYQFLSNSIK